MTSDFYCIVLRGGSKKQLGFVVSWETTWSLKAKGPEFTIPRIHDFFPMYKTMMKI